MNMTRRDLLATSLAPVVMPACEAIQTAPSRPMREATIVLLPPCCTNDLVIDHEILYLPPIPVRPTDDEACAYIAAQRMIGMVYSLLSPVTGEHEVILSPKVAYLGMPVLDVMRQIEEGLAERFTSSWTGSNWSVEGSRQHRRIERIYHLSPWSSS